MKTRNIFFVVLMSLVANVANAQYANNDDAAVAAFEKADSAFMSRNDKHSFYKDVNLSYAGNSAQTATLKERRNRGIFAGLEAGANYTTDHCVPAVGITLGLLTNHWIGKINGDLLFGSKPYEASDDQSHYLGGSLDAMIGRCIADGYDHHSQLFVTANIGYQRVRDYQNFGEWSAKSTEETPTEIITTTTKGKTDYMVNTSNMKYKAGFLYMYTPYNSNWAFMAEVNAGTMGQLNGGHGVKYTFTADARISVVYKFATGTRTNKKAKDMIKY
jgi:hypothetical protein